VSKWKQVIYMLVIIPLWVSYIVRAYSPLDIFLYSKISVIIGMVHIYTPFVLMPIYTALEQIPCIWRALPSRWFCRWVISWRLSCSVGQTIVR
jgi:ABC-type spermidine/putrescine transport system permease subunit I